MFISALTDTIESYDKYGLHRLNGFKIVYVYFILAAFNAVYCLPNPYFYFFYLPLTSMSAEVMMPEIKKKYQVFVLTTLITCAIAFAFNAFYYIPEFYLFVVFGLTFALYMLAHRVYPILLPLVPIILSLGSYSLLYPALNVSAEAMLRNLSVTVLSTVIIVGALLLFPLSYYYRCWLRAWQFLLRDLLDNLEKTLGNIPFESSIRHEHLKQMTVFADCLPYKMPTFSVLKINLLMSRLFLRYSVTTKAAKHLPQGELEKFISNVRDLIDAIDQQTLCSLTFKQDKDFISIINSWERLCHQVR